jgi:hypothetical protein
MSAAGVTTEIAERKAFEKLAALIERTVKLGDLENSATG